MLKYNNKSKIPIRFLYFLIVFAFLTFSWLFYHELIHFSTCEILGYNGEIIFNKTISMTNCEGIEKSTDIGKFLYIMMPYLVNIIILIPIFWLLYKQNLNINESIIRVLPYVLTFDTINNYFASLYRQSDFILVFKLLKDYWYFPVIPVIIILIIILLLIKRDIKLINKRII